MEENKRLSGTKVSAIANKFQLKSTAEKYNKSSPGYDSEMNDANVGSKEPATQVTVVRTESHVARFNNARALFEKLGEETRSNHSKERVINAGKIHELRSRSNSANSSSDCTSPTYSLHMNPLLLRCHDSSKTWSSSVPALTAERQLETNDSAFATKYDRVRKHIDEINLKEYGKENEFVDKCITSEQCEKKFNSKELIQKQKNWTSHFSKTRTSRYNSDPDKHVVEKSLNEAVVKNKFAEGLEHSLLDSYKPVTNKLSRNKFIDNVIFEERPASFNATCSSSKALSSPPPLPTRYSSTGDENKRKTQCIACSNSKNNEFLEFSTLNAFSNDSEKETPEYAVVQKNVTDKRVENLPIISLTQCKDKSKINFKSDAIHTYDYEITKQTHAVSKNHIANNKVPVTIDNADELLSTTIEIPPKTLDCKNKWLASNEEIPNDVIELNSAEESAEKYNKNEISDIIKGKDVNVLERYINVCESDTKSSGKESCFLSITSSPASIADNNKEGNAEKVTSQNLKYGQISYELNTDNSKNENLKTDTCNSSCEVDLDTANRCFNICIDTSTVNDHQIHSNLVFNENSTLCEQNKRKLNIDKYIDQNLVENDNYTNLNIKHTMNICNNLSCTCTPNPKNNATNTNDINKLDRSSDLSINFSGTVEMENNIDFMKQLPITQNINIIEEKNINVHNDNSDVLETYIIDSHLQSGNILQIGHINNDNLIAESLKCDDNTSPDLRTQENNKSFYNSLCIKQTECIFHNLTKNNQIDRNLVLNLGNKPASIDLAQHHEESRTETEYSTIPFYISATPSNQDNLSLRSRSDFTVDTLSGSRKGSVTSSESDILGSVGSLNDTQVDTETESQDYTPFGRKIILVENGVHYFEDGHFWMEVAGIPESEDDKEGCCESTLKKTAVTFDRGPIRVYSTHSINEYDRRNDEVDPVAASAEYELEKRVEKMEVFPVELLKGPDGLGLSIIGMGVGADAGLEKLGIFVKTITESGAAAQEGNIQVNDQIVEVDGKSLVGVTQAYAASVLRNTSGLVRFVIGRERDPKNSEVAILIKQSLQADKEREEDEILKSSRKEIIKDSVLYEQHIKNDNIKNDSRNMKQDMLKPDSPTIPSCSETERSRSPVNTYTSFLNNSRSPIVSSSTDDISSKQNDMDTLRMLLQELVELENNGASSEEYALKLRESGIRLHESERALSATRQDLANIREILLQLTNQNAIFQQKYARARRAARELRSDIISRDEFYQQLLQEKDTEYNALVKNLKDRVITLEVELTKIQKQFGMPVRLPYDGATSKIVTPQLSRRQLLPLPSSVSCQLSDTDTSDFSSPDDKDKTDTVERKIPVPIPLEEELDQAISPHSLLNNSAVKGTAELTSRAGLANRQLPKRSRGLSNSSSEYGLDESEDNSDEELSSKIEKSLNIISKSVKLNTRKKYLSSYINNSSINTQTRNLSDSMNSTIIKQHSTISSQVRALTEQSWQTSPRSSPVSLTEQLQKIFAERDRRYDAYDTSFSKENVNLNDSKNPESYQAKIVTRHLVEEIRHAVNKANQRAKNTSIGVTNSSYENTPWLYTDGSPSSISSTESSSPLATEQSEKKKNSELLLNSQDDWISPDVIKDEDSEKDNFCQILPVNDWSKEHVYDWLVRKGFQDLALRIIKAGITGSSFLRLESRDIKALNIHGDEKVMLKRKIKELRIQLENERKERKEIDRLKKKVEKISKKKLT